jgi:copper chaperone
MNQIFKVEGMTCAHCEKAITQAVLALDTKARIVIDRTVHRVEIDSTVERDTLAQAMSDEGYRVTA